MGNARAIWAQQEGYTSRLLEVKKYSGRVRKLFELESETPSPYIPPPTERCYKIYGMRMNVLGHIKAKNEKQAMDMARSQWPEASGAILKTS